MSYYDEQEEIVENQEPIKRKVMYSYSLEEHNKEYYEEKAKRDADREKLGTTNVMCIRADKTATPEDLKKAHRIALKMAKERGAKLSPIQEEALEMGIDF